jgi:hypothetical protein
MNELEFIKAGTNGFTRYAKFQSIPQKGDYAHLTFIENGYTVERQFYVKEIHHDIDRNKTTIYIK